MKRDTRAKVDHGVTMQAKKHIGFQWSEARLLDGGGIEDVVCSVKVGRFQRDFLSRFLSTTEILTSNRYEVEGWENLSQQIGSNWAYYKTPETIGGCSL